MDREFCKHILAHGLSEYLDSAASAEMCAEIERHMADCVDCRAVVDTLRQTIRLYRSLPDPVLPETVRERLYKSLDLAEFISPAR